MTAGTGLAVVVVLLAGNAFFVAAEFALVAARRTQLEPRAEAGSRAARQTLWAMDRVSLMMAGAQLGITACTLGLGAVGEPTVAHLLEDPFDTLGVPEGLLHPVAFAIALTAVTALHVIVGEMVPKNLTLAGPDRAALLLGPALAQLVRLTRPLITGLNAIANGVLRLMGVQPRDQISTSFSRTEVVDLVAESHREGLMDPDEHRLVAETLAFTQRQATDIAIPLDQIATVPVGATTAQIEELAGRTGYSRFPVNSPTGALTGYLHLKDTLAETGGARQVRTLPTIGADQPLTTALTTMRDSRAHLAHVVDQHDRTHGLITLDDILAALIPQRPGRPDRG